MLNIADVRKRKQSKPPITMLYARPGTGKTTLAASFPDPIFIQTEDGAGDLEIASFTQDGPIKSYPDLINALAQVLNEPHPFKSLAIDSINHAEPLITQYVCAINNWANIEAPGYGKGFTVLAAEFANFFGWIESIRNLRNMNIVLLGHPEASIAPDPHLDEHKRFMLKMDKRNASLTQEKCDGMFFLDRLVTMQDGGTGLAKDGPKKANTSGQRVLYTDGGASFEAKNRFKIPQQVMIPEVGGYGAIAQYLPGQDQLGMISQAHPNFGPLVEAMNAMANPEPAPAPAQEQPAPVQQVQQAPLADQTGALPH